MKKILVILLLILGMFSVSINTVSAENNPCKQYNFESDEINIGDALDQCLEGSQLIKGNDLNVESGGTFSDVIRKWVDNISVYLYVLAVGSIVVGALMMTLSAGEEDKIKKGKDVVKWGIIGFVGVLLAASIIKVVVQIMYSI